MKLGERIAELARLLDVSCDYLLTDIDEPAQADRISTIKGIKEV